MKIAIDSNVLFTFFWKESVFSAIAYKKGLELISPEYALEEIKKYEEEIQTKAKLSKSEFEKRKTELLMNADFIKLQEYQESFKDVKQIIQTLPKEEQEEFLSYIDFLSLAFKNNCPLWTNDKLLKNQKQIPILSTKEIIEIL